MTTEQIIERLEEQEEVLQFSHFTNTDAWDLGIAIVEEARFRGFKPAISIRLNNGYIVFQYGFDDTGLDHEHWMQRKVNLTMVKQMSSLKAKAILESQQLTLETWFLPESEYSTCGGAFPIRVRGVGMIGSIVASGILVVLDHDLVIGGICRYLGLDSVPRVLD
ncbi:MAG: heme-binding protein [Sphaerochaeta sp.]|nr:heme-binding protein [Sphaerochaeta sp.]